MYRSGAHTKHRLKYHMVWVPKYRQRVLKGSIAERIRELIQECAGINGWTIDKLNIQDDHVHILVQLNPDISVSTAVQFFKGGSSKVIRRDFPELKEFLWGDSFWSDGYFAETVGQCNEDIIRKYIDEQ